jgi:hypothetical protein
VEQRFGGNRRPLRHGQAQACHPRLVETRAAGQ